MTAFLDFTPLRRRVAKGFIRNCGCFSSARHRRPLPNSPPGKTVSCSQGQIPFLKSRPTPSPKTHRSEPLLPWGDETMRYTLILLSLLSEMTASNAGTSMDRLRLAQNKTVAECVADCNSSNFSCARNCGLSGACVAQCTVASAACKTECNRLK
jgi:hypothetical protein